MRQVISQRTIRAGHADADAPADSYRSRIVKYVPVEILAVFVALYGSCYWFLGNDPSFVVLSRWLVILCTAATVLYLWKAENVNDWVQLAVSTAGFLVWVMALGIATVADLPLYNQVLSALLLLVWVFAVPLIDGKPAQW